jgi:hypothetical protein
VIAQPKPEVTGKDVERVVHRDFTKDRSQEAFSILSEYGTDDWHKEPARVRLAALKLAAGDLGRLRNAIDTARSDYRDVLALAEYPEYFRSVDPSASTSGNELKRIIEADWKQYREWLAR